MKRFSDTANKVIFSNSFLTDYLENLKDKENVECYSTYSSDLSLHGSIEMKWNRLVWYQSWQH